MRRRSALSIGVLCCALSLTACATATAHGGYATYTADARTSEPSVEPVPGATSVPSSAGIAGIDARAQAQAWLDAAALPPGAVRSSVSTGRFDSYTGWPCGPVERLEGFWSIPGVTVVGTANWLRKHPTANLLSTAGGPAPDDPKITSAIVGYIPRPDAQEGIVYTIAKTADGVAVRAEVAALAPSATCPPVPGGGVWGAPGQG